MIAIIIILIMLSSSADAQTFDDLLRSGYTAYSVDQIEEAREILEELQMEYPDSHNGQLLQILVEIKEGDNIKAERMLVELDNSCDINSFSCDSPSVHIIAKLIRCKLLNSESEYRKADEMITGLFNNLSRACYENQIDIFIRNDNPAKACETCDGYINVSNDNLSQDITLKCFIVYYSSFRNEDARRLWGQLSSDNKGLLRKKFGRIEF